MLCTYVNNRVNRGISSGRRNIPFVAVFDSEGRGDIDRMGVVRKLNVERMSRDMTDNMLAHLPGNPFLQFFYHCLIQREKQIPILSQNPD